MGWQNRELDRTLISIIHIFGLQPAVLNEQKNPRLAKPCQAVPLLPLAVAPSLPLLLPPPLLPSPPPTLPPSLPPPSPSPPPLGQAVPRHTAQKSAKIAGFK